MGMELSLYVVRKGYKVDVNKLYDECACIGYGCGSWPLTKAFRELFGTQEYKCLDKMALYDLYDWVEDEMKEYEKGMEVVKMAATRSTDPEEVVQYMNSYYEYKDCRDSNQNVLDRLKLYMDMIEDCDLYAALSW